MEKIYKKISGIALLTVWMFTVQAQTVTNTNANIIVASGTTININGALVNGASINNGGTVKLTGDLTNNGTGSVGSGTMEFNGTSGLQNIGGSSVTTFGNLTINNNADVFLSNDAAVNGSLTFTDGKVSTGANKLSIASSGGVVGAGPARYVDGNLQKFIAAATASKNFEIGDGSDYTPINLTFAGTTNGTGSLTAHTTPGDHPQIASSGINPAASVNRYWTIANTGVTGFTSYNSTFNFINPGDVDAGAVPSSFKVRQYNGAWSPTTAGTATSTSTQATNMTTFTEYAIGTLISGYVWTGLGSDDNWTTAANWAPGVPPNVCGTNVTIPMGTPRNPVFTGNVSIGNIVLGDGKTIDVVNHSLTICGNWTGGSTTASTVTGAGSVILTGNAAQTMDGKTQFQTLAINKTSGTTATMQTGSAFDVYTAVELQNGELNTGTGTLTFKSPSVTQVAVLDNFSPGFAGTLTGTIHAERFYAAPSANSYNQHFIGSPVSNAGLAQFGAGGASGFVTPTANCDETQLQPGSVYGTVFSYDQSNGSACSIAGWKVESTAATATPAKGYSMAKTGSGTLTVTGTANLNPSYTQVGANGGWSGSTLQGHPMAAGWVLVSNPYLATLDYTGQSAQTGFTNQIKVWHTTGGFAGSYQDATVIAPFQAFFVRNLSTGASYTLDGALRTRNPQTFQLQNNDEQLSITSANNGTGLLDITTVAFNTDATDQFDVNYDANKMSGTIGRHNLYSLNNGTWMSKNILHSIAQTSTVDVGFEPGVSGSFTFTFDGLSSFDPTSYVMLEDKKLNTFYDVRTGNYNFTSDVADAWNRFVLHFTPKAEIAVSDQNCDILGTVHVTQPGTANWTYTLTDANNTVMGSGTLNSSNDATVNVAAGTYTLTLVDGNNYTVVKTITVNGNQPLAASFTPSTTTAETTDDIIFTSSNNATTYSWDFGDGTVLANQPASITHAYQTAGTYVITLTVTNAAGCSSTTTQSVTITEKVVNSIGKVIANSAITIWSSDDRVFIDFSKLRKVNAVVDIYNVLGQQLVHEQFGKSTIYTKQFKNLEAAYLIVRVKNETEIVDKKVFVGQ